MRTYSDRPETTQSESEAEAMTLPPKPGWSCDLYPGDRVVDPTLEPRRRRKKKSKHVSVIFLFCFIKTFLCLFVNVGVTFYRFTKRSCQHLPAVDNPEWHLRSFCVGWGIGQDEPCHRVLSSPDLPSHHLSSRLGCRAQVCIRKKSAGPAGCTRSRSGWWQKGPMITKCIILWVRLNYNIRANELKKICEISNCKS